MSNNPATDSPTAGRRPLAEQVQALRLPVTTGAGGGSGRLAWALCLILIGFCVWTLTRQAKLQRDAKLAVAAPAVDAPANAAARQDDGAVASAADAPPAPGDIALESKGYIIAAHQILVSPQVSGRLVMFNLEEGLRVAKGDVLAEIESTEYRSEFTRAEATLQLARQRLLELENGTRYEEIQQAQAEIAETDAQVRQLEAEWKRAALLVKNKTITDQDFEIIESKYLAIQRRMQRLRFGLKILEDGPRIERIDAARAEVRQAEADLAKAQYRLDNCTIRAPISGTILKKNAEQGNIVNPVALNGSFSLCDMADLSDLEVSLDIQERDVARVYAGQACQVRADAFPKRVYRGVVSRLMPIADRAKGAIPVRVKLEVPADEEGVYLKPEMGAVVTFLAGERPTSPIVAAPKSNAATSEPPRVELPLNDLPPSPSLELPPFGPAPAAATPSSSSAAETPAVDAAPVTAPMPIAVPAAEAPTSP